MLMSELFQVNIQRSLVTIFCLLKVTQLTVHKTQIVVRVCDVSMLRS